MTYSVQRKAGRRKRGGGICRRCKDRVKSGGDIHGEGKCRRDRWPPEVASEFQSRRHNDKVGRRRKKAKIAIERGEVIVGTGKVSKEAKSKKKKVATA